MMMQRSAVKAMLAISDEAPRLEPDAVAAGTPCDASHVCASGISAALAYSASTCAGLG
jgi:hypothetical protein